MDVSHSIRSAISGNLRELVEMQALNSASSVEHLRRFDALLRWDGNLSIVLYHLHVNSDSMQLQVDKTL